MPETRMLFYYLVPGETKFDGGESTQQSQIDDIIASDPDAVRGSEWDNASPGGTSWYILGLFADQSLHDEIPVKVNGVTRLGATFEEMDFAVRNISGLGNLVANQLNHQSYP